MIKNKRTVLELINNLKSFPEDMLVLTDGYEDGYEHILAPEMMEVSHKPENPYYSGEFQMKENDDIQTIKAVVIFRNRRDNPL
ncbi:MAG: hypothetical protein KJ826_10405 [Proteobacteria bacterium]|nr:hypothetical protein [Pseudomonadota bacterium]